MTAIEQLDDYLRQVQARLKFFTASRGAAITAVMALVLTLALVWIANQYRFAAQLVLPLRLVLFAAIAAAVAFGLAIPLSKLTRKRVTALAESEAPSFGERLLTVTERRDTANPFTELVAEDAMRIAGQHPVERFAENRALYGALGLGVLAAGVLVWLIAAGPGYWGYGSALLWTGSGNAAKRPMYELKVQPENITIRRKSDQVITAQLLGFSAQQVTLHAKYGAATKWDSATMQAAAAGNGYRFRFVGLADPVEYYVQADNTESKHFKISVRDLPAVKRVKVSVHYPGGLHLSDAVFDPGGDIRAVEGSQAEISVLTDKPLEHGILVLEDGSKLELGKGEGNWLSAHMPIRKDGSYHVAAIDGGETIRISDDYFVESGKDSPPTIRISKPGKDPHVTPIEEVPVTLEASDDFGVEAMDLHYSVNGGAEQVAPLLKTKGVKESSGHTLLTLENFKMAPGDLVSMYGTARDATHTAHTDIIFAQAEPFDFKFSQSQQSAGGGGGGMGNQQGDISERQKQIIAATWNEQRTQGHNPAAQENARFLANTETKLAEQAQTLAGRMGNREMEGAGAEFANFSKLMTQASQQMADASSELKPGKWRDALPKEQKALQSLLRAEALFRNIQVAFNRNSGGGGSGGGAQRDLARMLDLELDTSKNQYETAQQQQQQQQGDQQKAIDDAFERLKELARRQQELAAQGPQQQAFEQRWQEEQLRREAEELRRQIKELAQQQGQEGAQQQQEQQQGGSSGQSQGSGKQGRQMTEALRQSMNSLERAENEMRKAVSEHDAAAQRRASEELAQAQAAMSKALGQRADESVSDLARKAQELAKTQRGVADSLKRLYAQEGSASSRRLRPGQPEPGPDDQPEMKDPSSPRYYGYGRRNWEPEPPPPHVPSEEEQRLASQKERMAQQLREMQGQMQQRERSLASTQPGAAAKMRKALSEAEQKELAMRMQKTAEWMRQGFGDRNLNVETSMAAGLERLSRDLEEAQKAVKANGEDGRDVSPRADKNAEALNELRSLRRQLERAQGESRQQSSLQRGQQGQQGQQPGGQYSPQGGGEAVDGQAIRGAISDLHSLRGRIDPRDRALRGYVDDTIGSLRNLNADPNVLDSTIGQDAVSKLERLEVELARRSGDLQQLQAARLRAAEDSPEKYRDAVAEYFKKLSQTKR